MIVEASNCKKLWNYMSNTLACPNVALIINKIYFYELRIEY